MTSAGRRLIHLNGPPGIGKSTLARRYVAEHPGVLNCDIDSLRSFVGGWEQDFAGAGSLIRPAALAYLRHSGDVVLPQMLLNPTEIARFEDCATEAGATFVEIVLMDTPEGSAARFHHRGRGESDPWHDVVRRIVSGAGGDEELLRCHRELTAILESRPGAATVSTTEGRIDEAYGTFLSAVTTPGQSGS